MYLVNFDKLLETYTLEFLLEYNDLTEAQVLEFLYHEGYFRYIPLIPVDSYEQT